MKRRQSIRVLIFLALALGMGWAQGDSGQRPADNSQQPGTAPAPAFGQDNPPPQANDNPPLSGLDQPSLEPRVAARSFLLPGALVSESVDSNIGSDTGNVAVHGVTRATGSLLLKKLGNRYETDLDYVGGAAFYAGLNQGTHQIQQLNGEERVLWRTGQLAIRDTFSYLPEGSFGFGAFGGTGAYQVGMGGTPGLGGGIVGGGVGGLFGPGQFGSLGQQPRITNTAIVDIVKELTPRSSVTLAGSYGLVHFTGNTAGFVNSNQIAPFVDSNQVAAQAGYNYQINRKNQIALLYGFQDFHYPNFAGSTFTTHVGQLLYAHRITGRMDLLLGGGPQVTNINSPTFGSNQRITVSGRASLRYRFPRTTLGIHYERYSTSGSGFLLGANSDIARLSVSRSLSRLWDVIADLGYAHNSQIQPGGSIAATSYDYGYAGGMARRQLGRYFSLFLSYQFNDLAFDNSFCGLTGPRCDRTSRRHVAAVGLNWHPRPIRLD